MTQDNESSDNFLMNVVSYAAVAGIILMVTAVVILWLKMILFIFLDLPSWIQLAIVLFITFCLIVGFIIALIERMSQNKTLTKLE